MSDCLQYQIDIVALKSKIQELEKANVHSAVKISGVPMKAINAIQKVTPSSVSGSNSVEDKYSKAINEKEKLTLIEN